MNKDLETRVNSGSDDEAVLETIAALDRGEIRVATKDSSGEWHTHAWIKSAVLRYFSVREMERIEHGPFVYYDKIPLKTNYEDLGVRVVPPATARFGSFMEKGVVLMPSYVNIGAYIGERTMIDTWATVGSCAQIGKNCHLSGGVGIGGVLEPVGARPVIVEDGAFIGSRAILVEGVVVGQEAVISANVTLTASTPIIDTRTGKESKGYIPPRSVVLAGTKEKATPHGKIYTPCAYIIGERKESTDKKVSLNDALRDFGVSV
jgi:2,3,4,5-tetrahydropyridine-2,6-dicarboxylate N-succinyltransferase